MSTQLRLTIELVPRTSWYRNLRKMIAPEVWDELRRTAYADYGHRCGICGATGRLECHETWEYDDESHVQTLRGFVALCEWCHHVKHIGLSGILAREGKLQYEDVVRHFMDVNQCSRGAFEEHEREAFRQWRARSRHPWRVDLGRHQALVRGIPEGRTAAPERPASPTTDRGGQDATQA